jgi:hypothetical protein
VPTVSSVCSNDLRPTVKCLLIFYDQAEWTEFGALWRTSPAYRLWGYSFQAILNVCKTERNTALATLELQLKFQATHRFSFIDKCSTSCCDGWGERVVCLCVSRDGPDKLVTTQDRPREWGENQKFIFKYPTRGNTQHTMTEKVKSAYKIISNTNTASSTYERESVNRS